MNRIGYTSIALVGLIVSLMELVIAQNERMAYSLFFLSTLIIAGVYLFEEWRFYRRHNAILASFPFLVIPLLIIFIGNILSPFGMSYEIISFNMNLLNYNILAISSHTSLLLGIPIVITLKLTKKYYEEEYPGFVFRRKTFGPKLFPLVLHLGSIGIMILINSLFGYFDFLVLLFFVASFAQIITSLILPKLKQIQRTYENSSRRKSRRPFLSGIFGENNKRNRTRRVTSVNSTDLLRPSQRKDRKNTNRNVETSPSGGYRDIPVRSRNKKQTPKERPTQKPANIDNGLDMIQTSIKTVGNRKISDYLPKGKYTKEDLRCIVCYEYFNGNVKSNVIICPICHFPAHEFELKSWLNQSTRCPRCNKEIKSKKGLTTKFMISEKQYSSLIKNT